MKAASDRVSEYKLYINIAEITVLFFQKKLLSVLLVNNRVIIYDSFKCFSIGCECMRHAIEDYYSLLYS